MKTTHRDIEDPMVGIQFGRRQHDPLHPTRARPGPRRGGSAPFLDGQRQLTGHAPHVRHALHPRPRLAIQGELLDGQERLAELLGLLMRRASKIKLAITILVMIAAIAFAAVHSAQASAAASAKPSIAASIRDPLRPM